MPSLPFRSSTRRSRLGGAVFWAAAAIAAVPLSSPAAALTALEVNEATLKPGAGTREGADPVILRAQVLLDRARFSPGSIDGKTGDNFVNALDAFATANGLKPAGRLTTELWTALVATHEGPVLVPYTIAEADVKGPFLEKIPKEYEDMAQLKALGYTSPEEGLAEKFHVSVALLKSLNPKTRFDTAGEVIVVPDARPDPKPGARAQRAGQTAGPNAAQAPGGSKAGDKVRAARLEVDKAAHALRAYDAEDRLIATYPASIGSDEKPAPSGRTEVTAIALNPTYTYNPDYAFKGQKATKKVEVPAGPNNPVGAVWIDLAIESYGIHGTPEPERVGKTFSHGCVRLTNWDVKDLAGLVSKGTVVEFKD